MDFNKKDIVEPKVLWKVENDLVVTQQEGIKVVLNDTASIIWRKIDGFKSIQQILDEMCAEFSDKNPLQFIEDITMKSILMFYEDSLITFRNADLFGEWY